jgi:hypothetical protein
MITFKKTVSNNFFCIPKEIYGKIIKFLWIDLMFLILRFSNKFCKFQKNLDICSYKQENYAQDDVLIFNR